MKIKFFLIFSLFCLNITCFCAEKANKSDFSLFLKMSDSEVNKIANAIFIIEGGDKTKYPYGIKSIKTNNPRQVCINTIKNNYIRWQKSGKKENYLDFLANKYCPEKDDPVGNRNWKKNIKVLLAKKG